METAVLSERLRSEAWDYSPSLSQVLLKPPPRGFDTFAVVASNVRAVEAALLFSNGMLPFLAIVGLSSWGKSHLLEAVAGRIGTEGGPRSCELWSASEWLRSSRSRSTSSALLLDNAQDALSSARSRQHLRLALERRVKAGWPTLLSFTESRVTRPIRGVLPSARDWTLVTLRAPDAREREAVLAQMAEAEGVSLSADLSRILAHRLEGNGRTLVGALKRLRLAGTSWLSAADTLRACGLLNPFFASSSAWDLRDHVLETSCCLPQAESGPTCQELAVYTMLRVAQLSENDVARYLKLDPGRAYGLAQQVELALQFDEEARLKATGFVERIVATLQPS
jgi:hypothetical protein